MSSFPEITNKYSVSERERRILSFWKKMKVFEKSCKQTENGPSFVFYEGPPTANGKPGIHHILSRVYKDIYIRFYTQQGFHVPRKAGWDCHGLPVEREVEKLLGIKNKSEIEERYGIKRFNELCRDSVLRYISDWNAFSERMAFFVDLERPYFTMDSDYIEVVWGLLKRIWEKKLIYQDYSVVPYDPLLGSTMSDAEVDLGYREIEDPSLTVRFALAEEENPFGSPCSILVWTTTPWTLPANCALALSPNEEYVLIEKKEGDEASLEETDSPLAAKEKLISARKCLEFSLGTDYEKRYTILDSFKGKKLLGLKYQRLFSFLDIPQEEKAKSAWYILGADFVSMESGTGIVHIAPAYGADDLALAKKEELPLLHVVGLDGKFLPGSPYEDLFFKDADKPILRDLKERGLVWKIERYKHKYPFGYRTGSPLLYYAKHAWYIRTTELKAELLKNNESIRWIPENIKHGRFGKWLENNRDWALSRERYWGTPLPIWSDGAGHYRIVGSRQELAELCKKNPDTIKKSADLSSLELHRPFVDEIEFIDPEKSCLMRRIPEVIDCWFDSGAMPYAQWSRKERKEGLRECFPADFISEAVDQTRGWFYTLLCVSAMLSKKSSYKNVVCLGHVLDEKGEKMSKSKGNVVDPWTVFQSHGADAIRWYFLTGAPPGNSRRVGQSGSPHDPVGLAHNFLNMFRSSLAFFGLYANVDGIRIEKDWKDNPIAGAPPFAKRNAMDRWLLSLLQDLIDKVGRDLKNYNCLQAGRAIEEFLDALSNWYIRRNRRRFWKGSLDTDKRSAYDTLYRCLTSLARCLAPFAPFVAEEAFQTLVREPLRDIADTEGLSERDKSVVLAPWPQSDREKFYERAVLEEEELLRRVAFLGRAARMQSQLKIRQPLSRIFIYLEQEKQKGIILKNKSILLEELNVKEMEFLDNSTDILDYRIKINLPRAGKRLGSRIPLVQKYLKEREPASILRELEKKGKLVIAAPEGEEKGMQEESLKLEREDLLIESISKPGAPGLDEKGIFLSLDTKLSPELIAEGLARDLVRKIQELRKNTGLAVSDRIGLYVHGLDTAPGLSKALSLFGGYIAGETLAKIAQEKPKRTDAREKMTIQKEAVEVFLWKK